MNQIISKSLALSFIAVCVIFGQNCSDVGFSEMGGKKTQASDMFDPSKFGGNEPPGNEEPGNEQPGSEVPPVTNNGPGNESPMDDDSFDFDMGAPDPKEVHDFVENCLVPSEPGDLDDMFPGHSSFKNVRSDLILGVYESLEIKNVAANVSVRYAENLSSIKNIRGNVSVSLGEGDELKNLNKSVCVRVEGSVAEIKNVRGDVVIIGNGDEKASIGEIKNIRGKVHVVNANVKSIKNVMGGIVHLK